MKYYFSSPQRFTEIVADCGVPNVLLSYGCEFPENFEFWKQKGSDVEILVDSGAFSVWKNGQTVDLEAYIEFIKTCPSHWLFVSLDVIPPKNASNEDLQRAEEESFENYIEMIEKLPDFKERIIPVFHIGEAWELLDSYQALTSYVGIAPKVSTPLNQKLEFLYEVFLRWDYTTKYHGFGFSYFKHLENLPFYSIDSVSYMRSAVFHPYDTVDPDPLLRFLSFHLKDDKSIREFALRRDISFILQKIEYLTRLHAKRGITWTQKPNNPTEPEPSFPTS